MAFFEAYGLLSGDAGITLLDGLLNSKGFMGKRDDSEIRACAAMALGKIGSQKAMEALNKASGEKDVIVRNAVSRAVRSSQRRRTTSRAHARATARRCIARAAAGSCSTCSTASGS